MAAGVYVPSFQTGHAEHELNQKIRRSKFSREHDLEFVALLVAAAARQFPGFEPDVVVSMPVQPGEIDRFRYIRGELARHFDAADAGGSLRQIKAVSGYRQMTTADRWASSARRFAANGSIAGKSILLIDDVITTGAQADAATRALRAAGAKQVRFAAIAFATAAPEENLTSRWRRRAGAGKRNESLDARLVR